MRYLLLTVLLSASTLGAAGKTEILWDQYGVPHIFADSLESMFYAHGWAQMQNHADMLLRLYGESRGRAAEYWGESNLELDRWVQLNGVPERARTWYQQQDPAFRKYLDAFARGINDFAKAHPEHTSPKFRVVLPVSGIDVVGHSLRAVHYMYMGSRERMRHEVGALVPALRASQRPSNLVEPLAEAGSNTWAVGPSRSAGGKSMLIINPHLLWSEFYTYMEVHLVAPGYDLFGAPQIGFPVPVIGFNRRTGWGRTVNTIDTVDFYRLTTRAGKYEFDGDLRAFERETKTLKIKQPDGSLREEKLEIRRSVHGPVVFDAGGVTVAMRVAGIDRPKMLEQWFRMGGAQNLEEFKNALRMGSVPMWNANYADADGHIMLVFNGLVPKRKIEDYEYWNKVVPGDTSKTLWTEYHSFDDLPKSIDPPSGFNQNTNEPPWLSTLPQLDSAKYPAYMAPPNTRMPSLRTKRSLRMLSEDSAITYEELLAYKHSTRMELADATLPDLLKAAADSSEAGITDAARVLAQWDRQTDGASRGAVLFQMFADRYFGPSWTVDERLRVKYDPQHPLESAYGLADPAAALQALAAAAKECRRIYGALDVPWGEVYRYSRGQKDLPGNGADGKMGVFRTMQFARKEGNRFYPTHGETFVCAIEFAIPQRAQCLLGYGNASQPGSAHIDDQLPFMVEKKLLPVLRERKEIEEHLEKREQF
jgi:acyl-homoserine-lactone acylase